jgi:hypothetical protein
MLVASIVVSAVLYLCVGVAIGIGRVTELYNLIEKKLAGEGPRDTLDRVVFVILVALLTITWPIEVVVEFIVWLVWRGIRGVRS